MAEEKGFFDTLGTIGTTLGFAADPIGASVSMIGREIASNKNSQAELESENMPYNDPYSSGFGSFGTSNTVTPSNGGSFFGNLGQTIGGFGRDVGQFFQDIQPATSLFGLNLPTQRTNSGTAATIVRQAPDETASSGEILGANLGLGSNLIQAATRFARSPAGGSAIGFGAGAIGAAMTGGQNGAPRITRKMKSDVRRIYMMAGMDPNATAQILNNLGTYPRMNFDASLVFFILTKRFRNDGPVVTKAAVRKTKTTLRRMKGVVDMYNSVCKPAPRRAPVRRSAIKAVQIKN